MADLEPLRAVVLLIMVYLSPTKKSPECEQVGLAGDWEGIKWVRCGLGGSLMTWRQTLEPSLQVLPPTTLQ